MVSYILQLFSCCDYRIQGQCEKHLKFWKNLRETLRSFQIFQKLRVQIRLKFFQFLVKTAVKKQRCVFVQRKIRADHVLSHLVLQLVTQLLAAGQSQKHIAVLEL